MNIIDNTSLNPIGENFSTECAEAPRDDGTHAPCEREGEKRADDPVWHFPCSEDSNEPGKTEPFEGFALVCKDGGWKAVEAWLGCLTAQGVARVSGGAKKGLPERAGGEGRVDVKRGKVVEGEDNVGTTGSASDCCLVPRESRLDNGSDNVHEHGSESAAEGGGKLQRPLPSGGIGAVLLRYPHSKVGVRAKDGGAGDVPCVCGMEGLPKEEGVESETVMIYFVRSAVNACS